jgi:hypothetical protein
MNKPDISDGSRGQLTTATDTCHLLQIQSPWTQIRETGQTHSFATFRTYKEWVPVVLRVPSASTRIFLRVKDTDTYQQSASMCVYRATQDGSWGLTFVIYFNHGIQVFSWWRNSRIIRRSLVWLFQPPKYSGYITMIYKNLAPDGSNVIYEFLLHLPCSYSWINIIGCAPSAPDGSSPWGYSRKFFCSSIGSNIVCSIFILQLEIIW